MKIDGIFATIQEKVEKEGYVEFTIDGELYIICDQQVMDWKPQSTYEGECKWFIQGKNLRYQGLLDIEPAVHFNGKSQYKKMVQALSRIFLMSRNKELILLEKEEVNEENVEKEAEIA